MDDKFTEWQEEYKRYLRLQKKADSTIKTYWGGVGHFLNHFQEENIERLNSKQIADYILNYDSARTMEQKKYSIQLFYGVVFGQWKKLQWIPLPKRENKIPQVLNIDECYKLFSSINQIKHRAIIQLIYACALRRSELINIRIRHIDGKAKRLFIEQSKGAKDRVIPIPEETLVLLRAYFKEHFPNGFDKDSFLFQGQSKNNEGYSSASMYAIFKRAVKKAGITKKVKLHTLRHSRATHLYNAKMDIRDLAELLGHSNTRTTEIYIHTGSEDLQVKVEDADEIIKSKISPVLLKTYNQKLLTN